MHLRTGDTVPCDDVRIDERGVTFKSPVSDATFVPHDRVKALELRPEATRAIRPSKTQRERLLMLPRLQKEDPPTHLVRSVSGDYLRGRLLELDPSRLRMAIRLEEKELPRDRISRIIWLHKDEQDGGPAAAAPAEPAGLRVQAVRIGGNRLTFAAERVLGTMLSGTSDVLGACHVELREINQLILGRAIEQAAAESAYGAWRLQPAPEPKFAQQAEGGEKTARAPGTASPLVGQPAPDFTLDLLGGGKYRLSEHRGRIVVLDFWATWCGPCMQTLPQVEQLVKEFAGQGVELLAVNVQEEAEPIKAVLQRHKLEPQVALDRDRVAADKYGTDAIPQTVIIDRAGTVSRLFVGGGPRYVEQLRAALQSLLSGS